MPRSLIGSARDRRRRGTALSARSSASSTVAAATSTANAAAKGREATATTSRLEQPLSLGARPLALEWLPLGLGKWALDPAVVGGLSRCSPTMASRSAAPASRRAVSRRHARREEPRPPSLIGNHAQRARGGTCE